MQSIFYNPPCIKKSDPPKRAAHHNQNQPYYGSSTSIIFNKLRPSHPHLLALQPPYQKHNTHEDEKERTQETEQGNKFCSVKFLHRSPQPLRNQVHTRHHHQREEESEDQPEDDRPAQRSPEHHTIPSKENIRTQVT